MIYIRSSFIKNYSCDDIAFQIIDLLKRSNIPFRVANQSFAEDMELNGLKNYEFGERSKAEFQLVINPACYLDQFGLDKNSIVYTMWDSDILPPKYVLEVQRARLCIVPSNATKEVFIRSGVTIPIEVIPHGFDPTIFHPMSGKSPYAKPFKFGCSGQITSELNDKKDIGDIIYAFRMAFLNKEEVSLDIKIPHDSIVPKQVYDPRINLIQSNYSKEQMSSWYNSLNCFVNISKYEAFGRQPLEAMACGTPVISTLHSGMLDYFNDNLGYVIGHTRVNANTPPYTEGHWYKANIDELVSMMRYAYRFSGEIRNTGQDASNYVHENWSDWNWQPKLIRLLRRYCYY